MLAPAGDALALKVGTGALLRCWGRLLGPVCWALTPLSFVAQVIVAGAWRPAYSIRLNKISDLGLQAPSPRHALMNASLVALGLLTIGGVLGSSRHWPASTAAIVGLACLALAGTGRALLGIAPGDANLPVHKLGAVFQFHGAVGVVLVGLATSRGRRWERRLSLTVGAVASFACLLCGAEIYSLLGIGVTERLAFDTQTAWTGIMGMSLVGRSWGLATPSILALHGPAGAGRARSRRRSSSPRPR